MEKIDLKITGMACGGCASSIKEALLRLDGVETAEVTHADGRAVVEYDPTRVSPDVLKAAIVQLGYQAG